MDIGRPAPGEELNPGAETVPAPGGDGDPAARRSTTALEVLLVQRNPASRFMGGAWVFPGGAVDAHEGEGDAALRAAAVRELDEEAGVRVPDPTRSCRSRAGSRRPRSRPASTPGSSWLRCRTAPCRSWTAARSSTRAGTSRRRRCGRASAEEMLLVFPTIKHLEQLSSFRSADELIEYARGREVRPGPAAGPVRRRDRARRAARRARLRGLRSRCRTPRSQPPDPAG